jgi:hypothetical protein
VLEEDPDMMLDEKTKLISFFNAEIIDVAVVPDTKYTVIVDSKQEVHLFLENKKLTTQ